MWYNYFVINDSKFYHTMINTVHTSVPFSFAFPLQVVNIHFEIGDIIYKHIDLILIYKQAVASATSSMIISPVVLSSLTFATPLYYSPTYVTPLYRHTHSGSSGKFTCRMNFKAVGSLGADPACILVSPTDISINKSNISNHNDSLTTTKPKNFRIHTPLGGRIQCNIWTISDTQWFTPFLVSALGPMFSVYFYGFEV